MSNEVKRFSDFAKETILDGTKIRIDDMLNKEVMILAYRVTDSKHSDRDCLTIQLQYDNQHHVIFTGSAVLADQIKKYESELPFMATIRKINKYYSLT